MSRAIRLALVLTLTSACPSTPPPTKTEARTSEGGEPSGEPPPEQGVIERQTIAAAGLSVAVPSTWTLLAEDDPMFALAYDPTQKQPAACWIERRRQGLGPLPVGTRAIEESEGRRGYMRGVVRGIIDERALPGGGTLVVHCRAKRSDTKLWSTIIAPAMASIAIGETPAGDPAGATGPDAIVELCSAAPIVPSYTCALQADGEVFCGQTDAPLTRIELPPASDIGCHGMVACARASTGEVSCWVPAASPQPQPQFGLARSVVDACVVDEAGALHCLHARPREGGGHELTSTPLHPFEEPSLALADVHALMSGSSAAQGCVATSTDVMCWDERGELPVRFDAPAIAGDEATGVRRQAPESIDARSGVVELRRLGDRLCTRDASPRWRCTTQTGEVHELSSCAGEPCGCSLMGGHELTCEDSPEPRIDALPQGRLAGIVATAEPCVARVDGSIACRKMGTTELAVLLGPGTMPAPSTPAPASPAH